MLLNIVHRHVRKTWAKQTIPNEQRRFWATHVNRNNLRSGFPSSLFVWEAKRKVFLLFSVRRFTPFPRKKNRSSQVTTGSESCTFSICPDDKCPALTNIKAICLKIWQNHCPKNKRPLPADVLRSKSAQLTRVPIVARAVGEGPN